jgi:tetrapyrrole methylase family protein/MazG family protein
VTLSESKQHKISELVEVIRTLLSENGCPWDREQTHSTLKKFLIEECAELLDAIDDNDDEGICEELGDILMHIVFHSAIAEKEGRFSFDDVIEVVTAKMIRRHPHVFGTETAENADAVLDIWHKVKSEEKGDRGFTSVLDGIPRHMPALSRARDLQKKAAKVGFDWEKQEQVLEKIEEELEELKQAFASGDNSAIEEEIGDLLFAVVNFSRFRKGTPAEELLAKANEKFINRFRYIEQQLKKQGKTPDDASIEEMEFLWNKSKTALQQS